MNPILRNVLIVICSVIGGGLLNMGIIKISGFLIPPPIGADVLTMAGLKQSMHLMQPKHFLMPFLAHALGTLLAAFLVTRFTESEHRLRYALGVSCWFLLGGATAVYMLPSPFWFSVVDLGFAYLPMGYLGWKLAENGK